MWTTPTTRSTGDLITAAIWNADIVDNLNFLYGSLPSARAYHNASQALAAGTLVLLALNTERWDNDVIHDTSSNNSRLTCKTAGKYIIGGVWEDSVASQQMSVRIRLNGATIISYESDVGAANLDRVIGTTTLYDLAVNDYVELGAMDYSGANANSSGNYSPEFWMHRIGG